jgi:hypothetical protein
VHPFDWFAEHQLGELSMFEDTAMPAVALFACIEDFAPGDADIASMRRRFAIAVSRARSWQGRQPASQADSGDDVGPGHDAAVEVDFDVPARLGPSASGDGNPSVGEVDQAGVERVDDGGGAVA